MKSKVTFLLCVSMFLSIATAACSSGTDSQEAPLASPAKKTGITWYGYDEGIALGKKEGKKVLLHFFADWCGYCKKMEKEIFSQEDSADYINLNFVPIRLDSDVEKQLSIAYGVSALPTTWFLGKGGEKIQKLPGYLPKNMFMAFLEYIQTDSYQNVSFESFMATQ